VRIEIEDGSISRECEVGADCFFGSILSCEGKRKGVASQYCGNLAGQAKQSNEASAKYRDRLCAGENRSNELSRIDYTATLAGETPIAVGTVIADRPPHRSVREVLPHTAPPLGQTIAMQYIVTGRGDRAVPMTLNPALSPQRRRQFDNASLR
jgi:hypothetical protein